MDMKQVLLLWLILPFAGSFPQATEPPTETTPPIETTALNMETTPSNTETNQGSPPNTGDTDPPPANTETPPPKDCNTEVCDPGMHCVIVKPNCTAPTARCLCLNRRDASCVEKPIELYPHCPEDHESWLNDMFERSFRVKMDDFGDPCDHTVEAELEKTLSIYHRVDNPYFVAPVEDMVKASPLNLCDPRRLMRCEQEKNKLYRCACMSSHPKTARRRYPQPRDHIASTQCYPIEGKCNAFAAMILPQFPIAMVETTNVYGDPSQSDHNVNRLPNECLANLCADIDFINKKCKPFSRGKGNRAPSSG